MTKDTLIKAVAEATNYSQDSVKAVINNFLSQISGALERGDDVKVYGFGNLVLKPRPARTVRLYGKESTPVPERWYPVFEPGGKLQQAGRDLVRVKPLPVKEPKAKKEQASESKSHTSPSNQL